MGTHVCMCPFDLRKHIPYFVQENDNTLRVQLSSPCETEDTAGINRVRRASKDGKFIFVSRSHVENFAWFYLSVLNLHYIVVLCFLLVSTPLHSCARLA